MTVRRATPQDVAAILTIQNENPTGPFWKGPDYLEYVSIVAEIEGQIAGYLMARQVAEGEFEILNVGVAREFRRRGAALSLLRRQLAEWKGEWFLEVRASNVAARSLYRKAGFVDVGVRKLYYGDPPEDGIVMRIRSC